MNEQNSTSHLIELLTPLVRPLGYEIVHLEVISSRQKTLRVFIDRLESQAKSGPVGIEDCVIVARALDEPLDSMTDVDQAFGNANYELEVSSPGIDRPLRTPRDFERFAGQEVRIHVYRPLTAEELNNSTYQSKNPKQKNFLGLLKGFKKAPQGDCVLMEIAKDASGARSAKSSPKSSKVKSKGPAENGAQNGQNAGLLPKNSVDEVSIPLPLIAKANLEPSLEPLFAKDERE